jgi:hypothetical protein
MTRAQTVEIGLGTTPTNPAPTRAGQVLVLHDALPETSVLVDDVSDEAWEAICVKAAELRDAEIPEFEGLRAV